MRRSRRTAKSDRSKAALLTGPGCKGHPRAIQTQPWLRPPGFAPPPKNHPTGASQQGSYWNIPNDQPIGLSGTGLQSSTARPSASETSSGLLSNLPPHPPVERHPHAIQLQSLRSNPRFKRNNDGTEPSSSRIPKKPRSTMDERHQMYAKPAPPTWHNTAHTLSTA